MDVIERANDFEIGWPTGPIYSGDYPQVMKDTMKERLPTFTPEEKKLSVTTLWVTSTTPFLTIPFFSIHPSTV